MPYHVHIGAPINPTIGVTFKEIRLSPAEWKRQRVSFDQVAACGWRIGDLSFLNCFTVRANRTPKPTGYFLSTVGSEYELKPETYINMHVHIC